MGQTRSLFVHFCPFLNTMTNIVQNYTIKCVDGVLGIQTLDRSTVGADESTELWRHPKKDIICV